MAIAISADRLAAGYPGVRAWDRATFEIMSGEFIAVLGPNGAGKSTLFRLLLGLVSPISGSLTVLGQTPHRGNPRIGYLPQRRSFDADLPIQGRDLVRFGLDGHRWGFPLPGRSDGAEDRVARAIADAEAQTYDDRPVGRLSGGEQQRLALAQALVGDPELLLLDEPLASLDLRNQVAMSSLVHGVSRKRGLTVLLIAHDVNPLLGLIDRVLYVARGRIAIGKPDAVITTETLSRLYGTPVEVLRDSRGRVFVAGVEEETAHPHVGDA